MADTKYGGYAGKVIKIDLTTQTISDYPWTDTDRRLFAGGKIMAAKILYDYIKAPIDPFGEENILVITTGAFTCNGVPSSSRFNISGVSPQTGLIASSNCGGSFGSQMKKCGYDGIILTGKAKQKTLIKIENEKISFESAEALWGLKTTDVQEKIGGRCAKFVIGPAGENLVKYAGVFSDDRTAGRAGLGAVLGSKNIKGLTAQGTKSTYCFDKERQAYLCKKWTNRLRSHPLTGKQLPRLGSAGLVSSMQAHHLLASRNFGQGQFEHFDKVSGEAMAEQLVKNKGCLTCPIQCARVVNVEGKDVKGPELEIMGLMGGNIMNDDLDSILKWNYEMDEWGMDGISTAGTLAFAMELNEKGLWDNGLQFGKNDNISEAIESIALRKGIGNDLAEGTRFLSNKYGGKEFAINVKGMELSAYEPRAAVGMGLGYATSSRGGCHLNGGYMVIMEGLGLTINQYTVKGKAQFTMVFQDLMEAVSAFGCCLFTTYALFPGFLITKPNSFITVTVNKVAPYIGPIVDIANHHPGILSLNLAAILPHPLVFQYVTGIKMNIGKMKRIGERGFNLERVINMRLGLKGSDDDLPKRLTEDLQQPNNKKSKVPIKKLIKKYYKSRGWSKDGAPTETLLKHLSIEENAYNKEVEKDAELAKTEAAKSPKQKEKEALLREKDLIKFRAKVAKAEASKAAKAAKASKDEAKKAVEPQTPAEK